MEKPVAVLEISSSSIKLVVGYELNGQPYVLYSLVKPFNLIVDSGTFIDPVLIKESIASMSNILDDSARVKINISEAIVILPPYGLEVFHTQQVTTVVGEDNKVSPLDIRNIFAIIRKGKIPVANGLIDIIPEKYTLDEGVSYQTPPIGLKSQTLAIRAMVHTLPTHISANYQDIVREAGVNVKRTFIAPFAASELLGTYDEVPSEYLLVDIGSHVTTVSFVGGKQLYSSRFFKWGGHNITSKIGETFNISEIEAEKIKVMYGLDKRKMNYQIPICKTDDGTGRETKHTVEELSAIVKSELDIFTSQLNSTINNLLSAYESSAKTIPIFLVGGGSLLNGLAEYLEPKVQSDYVKVVNVKTLGARNPSLINCLGAVVANSKYQTVFDDMHPRVGQVSRNPKE